MSARMAMSEEERKARKAEQARQRRAANPEKDREALRKWRAANPEKVEEQQRRNKETRPKKIRLTLSEEERKLRRQESLRKWQEANRDKIRAYREANREKILEDRRRYYETNRDCVLDRNRQWSKDNPEKTSEYKRKWKRDNPAAVLQCTNNRRARKQGALDPCAPVTASVTRQRAWLFGNACAYCGSDGPLHLDHVEPLALGGLHIPDNLVPACQRCNLSKQAKPVEAWYLSQPFFSPERWEALQAHTGRRWSAAEQLPLMDLLSA